MHFNDQTNPNFDDQGTAGKAAVRFVSYDTIRNSLSDEYGKLSAGGGILAGMAAGAVESVSAVTPTERIKTALLVFWPIVIGEDLFLITSNRIDDAKTNRQFKSGMYAAKVLVRRQGLSELYRGLVSTTIKQSATSAVRMGTYNILKEMTKKQRITSNVLTSFGRGALAGIVTVYATQPFDTIRTRAQSVQGAGIIEAVKSVMRDYGVQGVLERKLYATWASFPQWWNRVLGI